MTPGAGVLAGADDSVVLLARITHVTRCPPSSTAAATVLSVSPHATGPRAISDPNAPVVSSLDTVTVTAYARETVSALRLMFTVYTGHDPTSYTVSGSAVFSVVVVVVIGGGCVVGGCVVGGSVIFAVVGCVGDVGVGVHVDADVVCACVVAGGISVVVTGVGTALHVCSTSDQLHAGAAAAHSVHVSRAAQSARLDRSATSRTILDDSARPTVPQASVT